MTTNLGKPAPIHFSDEDMHRHREECIALRIPQSGDAVLDAMIREAVRRELAGRFVQGMLSVPDDQRYGDRADKALTVDQWQAWCVTGMTEHALRAADALLAALEASQ
jgi:hypothetical protein